MWYVKIVGALVVLISGTTLGISYGWDMQNRYKELWAMKRSISILQSNLEYGGMSLYEIFLQVKRQSIEVHKGFWTYLSDTTKEKSSVMFEDIWKEGVGTKLGLSCMTSEDKEELISLGLILGNGDKKQQIRELALCQMRVENILNELEKEKASKLKLYNSLGVVGSIFLIVLLF